MTPLPSSSRRLGVPGRGAALVLSACLVAGMAVGGAPAPAASTPDGGSEGGSAGPPVSGAAVVDSTLRPLRQGDRDAPQPVPPAFHAWAGLDTLHLGLTALPVLPGESVGLGGEALRLVVQAGGVQSTGPGRWRWTAPNAPGAYALRMEAEGGAVLHLTAWVAHPAEWVRNGSLRGYRIGSYRPLPPGGNEVHRPPDGFVEVGARDRDLLVSPRFTVGQFLCKQAGEPRFLALSGPLLVKLEAVADRAAATGWDPGALVVMSGYRTPAYNRAIGNTTSLSRHLWGDAADLYLDGDADGEMDDLDGNGRVDLADARVMARWVEEAVGRPGVRPGGLALYRRNAVHGPFVHVDARGAQARW